MATIKSSGQRITPCLWFDKNAEIAVEFYKSVFKKFKIGAVTRYGKGGMMPEGLVLTIAFQIEGQDFLALNGGPVFHFTEAVSFIVNCKTQTEIDYYWEKLSKGGSKSQCGWLKDRFGLSWQVVPSMLDELLTTKDASKADRVMKALLKMKKLEIKKLKDAAAK